MTTCLMILFTVIHPIDAQNYQCVLYRDDPVPMEPPTHEIPIHMTNYNPWDEQGILMVSGNKTSQCDNDCSRTAAGFEIPTKAEDLNTYVAACPFPDVGFEITIRGVKYFCWDTFGNEYYRAGPFFHEGRGVWVYPVDILTPHPIYQLVPAEEWYFTPPWNEEVVQPLTETITQEDRWILQE
jgi:hypothetical protein